MSSPLKSPGAAGRAAFRQSFPDEASRSAHYREIGMVGNANRAVLSGEERRALVDAFALLRRIAVRHGFDAEIMAANCQGRRAAVDEQ